MSAQEPDFPPERHVIRDLAMTSQRVAEGRHVTVAPVPDSVRDRAGRPMVGLLATLADAVAAGVVLPAVNPDWTARSSVRSGPTLGWGGPGPGWSPRG